MTTPGELAMQLLLRLSDDEAALDADAVDEGARFVDADPQSERLIWRFTDEDRLRRDIAAKRAIIDLCMTETDATGGKPIAMRILRHLAAIYDT